MFRALPNRYPGDETDGGGTRDHKSGPEILVVGTKIFHLCFIAV
jgi:hypothetical protein